MNYTDLRETVKFLKDNEMISDQQYNRELYILDYHENKDLNENLNIT